MSSPRTSLGNVLEAVRVAQPTARLQPEHATDTAVTSVEQSTDAVAPGSLFVAIRGANTDGHDLVTAAVTAGAAAVLAQRDLPPDLGVPSIVVDDSRLAMAHAASELWGHPSRQLSVVGVTGTNGKTTVTHLLASIVKAAGQSADVLGTLSGARTTPASNDLAAWLAGARDRGVQTVAMEVSSHGLVQHRVAGTRFAVGVFTNLGHDHLDYHRTLDEYFDAKAMLFEPDRCAAAVVNTDDEHGRRLLASVSIPAAGYSLDEISELEMSGSGSRFAWRGRWVELAMPGRFNVSNALAAATAALALGLTEDAVVDGLRAVEPVRGRFQSIEAGQDFAAIVDFAHTPDALTQALMAARELTTGRVIVVFGCGGDRDRQKRPEMGAVAARFADEVIVTSDNPRNEEPEAIIDEILGGIPATATPIRESDRGMAISLAVSRAQNGDLVLVAGKGHETTQTIGDETHDFDDVEVLRAAISEMRGATTG